RSGPGSSRNARTAARRPRCGSMIHAREGASLLELDRRALLLEGLLELLSLVLLEGFLNHLRCAFNQILGFLEAQAGRGTDFLDDLDLLVARGLEDDVEGRLLFRRLSSATAGATRHHHDTATGGGLDAVGFLE